MNPINPAAKDQALRDFAARWKMDGDWMVCRACRSALIASRDGEALRHRSDCVRRECHDHPWRELRAILNAAVPA